MIQATKRIDATTTRDAAAAAAWDAIIVGAGPAGAFAALRLAQAGAKTLLVERKAFPRDKICGGCVSHRAIDLLRAAGLERALAAAPASATRALRLYAAGRQATISIPEGLAAARSDLDALLVEAAIAAGADFLPQTLAEIGAVAASRRAVRLRGAGGSGATCLASVVLAADGLALAGLPDELAAGNIVTPESRIGVGVVLCQSHVVVEPGMIHMAVGDRGYVGLAATQPGRLLVAAALDAGLLAAERHPAAAVAAVLASAGRDQWAAAMSGVYRAANWGGTPPLTRRLRRPAAERLLVLGDAAGYVEPFTGEGIGWALAAAENAVGPALAARRGWSEGLEARWMALHGRSLARRRRFCRAVALGLRSPLLVSAAMRVLAIAPGWSAPVVWLWNRPLPVWRSREGGGGEDG